MSDTSNESSIAEVLEAERQRCKAIAEQDGAALNLLFSDDLTYIHATGEVESKDHFVARLQDGSRTLTRSNLRVRVYGDVAIMTGNMHLSAEGRPAMDFVNTQVWVKELGRWVLVAFHGSRTDQVS